MERAVPFDFPPEQRVFPVFSMKTSLVPRRRSLVEHGACGVMGMLLATLLPRPLLGNMHGVWGRDRIQTESTGRLGTGPHPNRAWTASGDGAVSKQSVHGVWRRGSIQTGRSRRLGAGQYPNRACSIISRAARPIMK